MAQHNPINWVQETLQKQGKTLVERFVMDPIEEASGIGFGFRISDRTTGEAFEVHGLGQKKAAKQACFHEVWKVWQARGVVSMPQSATMPQLNNGVIGLVAPIPAQGSAAERVRADAPRWLSLAKALHVELAHLQGAALQEVQRAGVASDPHISTLAHRATGMSAALVDILGHLAAAASAPPPMVPPAGMHAAYGAHAAYGTSAGGGSAVAGAGTAAVGGPAVHGDQYVPVSTAVVAVGGPGVLHMPASTAHAPAASAAHSQAASAALHELPAAAASAAVGQWPEDPARLLQEALTPLPAPILPPPSSVSLAELAAAHAQGGGAVEENAGVTREAAVQATKRIKLEASG